MGALFEILSGTEKLACNFYFSTVSPDNQTGAGMPQRSPGLRPNFQVQHLLCPACGLTLTEVLESWRAWEVWRARNPGNNGTNGFGFAPGDDGPGGNGNWNNQQDPDNSGNEGDGDYQGSGAGHYNSQSSCSTASGPFSILNPVGGSRSLNSPPLSLPPTPLHPHNQQHIITTCKPCNTPQQDGSDSDSDYSDSSHNDEADHEEERAARKIHLLLSEIPTPAWQDIVMDRAAWNKMLRNIYTN